jgi:hypothetical protein
MIHAIPVWKFEADIYLAKLQRLRKKLLHTTGNYPSAHRFAHLHMAFKLPYYMIMKQNRAGNKQKS